MNSRFSAAGAVLTIVLTAAVFGPVAGHQFLNLDDPAYILENPAVRQGLTRSSVAWAFTAFHAANWHPLTWLSHMLDVELFGLDPAGHHLVNVILHAAAAVTLLRVLTALTAAPWPSLWAALAFAIHPLRVESVAWAAERKDVLAAMLWMLGLGAYLRYVRRPGAIRWLTLFFVFALGLMAKPMLVTFPLALLLLDFWPLGRTRGGPGLGRLLREKAPLFVLSIGAAVLAVKAQGMSVVPVEVIPLGERLANAAVSAVAYLGKILWPSSLAVYYPLTPGGPGLFTILAALIIIVSASAMAILTVRRRPYLFTGWGLYLVILLPVLGLVQVGEQAGADRYTYLPSLGCSLAILWLLRDFARDRPRRQAALAAAGVLLILGWSVATARYLQRWENGASLFEHALRVTRGNWLVHFAYGGELARHGRFDESLEQFRLVTILKPEYAEGHFNLGVSYDAKGDAARAAVCYHEALRLRPDHAEAHNNLGVVYARAGDLAPAIEHFRAALRRRADFSEARQNLEQALAAAGDQRRASSSRRP